MNVYVQGQDSVWTRQLSELCKKDEINLYEREDPKIAVQLIITDFPIEKARKGILEKIPFLVVSKEKEEEKILEAFQKGAEDYMIYPISPKIAEARIRRILKRYEMEEEPLRSLHEEVHFTPNEYRILSHMMAYPGKVFSRSELIEEALTRDYEGFDRNVDNYIKQIRKKLEQNPDRPKHIQTIYGKGYRYVP